MPPFRITRLFALIALAGSILAAPRAARAQASVAIPNSRVGAILKEWVDAFNKADSAALTAFYAAHLPQATSQASLRLARTSGGLDFVRILTAEPSRITFAARTRTGATGLRGAIQLADNDAVRLTTFGIQAVPPGASLEGCSAYGAPSTHGTSAADVASEDAIVAALYSVISGPACEHRDWDRFRGLFVPGGRLIPKVAGPNGTFATRVETPEEYSASVQGSMEEFGFFEKEVSHVDESFNGVTHRFSTYESRRTANDATPFARGINSIQLFFDGRRWWVVTVYWAAEQPNAPIPAIYLNRPPPQ